MVILGLLTLARRRDDDGFSVDSEKILTTQIHVVRGDEDFISARRVETEVC